jgi:opacity protein-like surface antigen
MHRLLFATAIVLFLPAATAHAQSPLDQDTWFVSPAVGFAFDGDADVSPALAAAVGVPLTSVLAAEGELGHLFDMAPGDPDVDSSLTTVHVALLYFFDTEFVATPYVAGGIGLGRFSHDVDVPPASIDQTEVGFNLGGGVTYRIADRLWLRGDVRYFKHIDDVPSAFRLLAGVTVRFDR